MFCHYGQKAEGTFREQSGASWCSGNALRQLEEGKTAQKIDKVCLTLSL